MPTDHLRRRVDAVLDLSWVRGGALQRDGSPLDRPRAVPGRSRPSVRGWPGAGRTVEEGGASIRWREMGAGVQRVGPDAHLHVREREGTDRARAARGHGADRGVRGRHGLFLMSAADPVWGMLLCTTDGTSTISVSLLWWIVRPN